MSTLKIATIIALGAIIGFVIGHNTKSQPLSKKVESQVSVASLPTINVATATSSDAPSNTQIETADVRKVTRAIDGDTIELEDGQRVRYIGIDTPETVDPRKPVMCFGKEASRRNRELVEGKMARLVKDITDKDKYGRLLRYVYVGDVFINETLVREGYARVYTYPPDVAMNERFLDAERRARAEKAGLWNDCLPSDSNTSISPTSDVGEMGGAGDGCDIKGNISANGEKIYHMQGQSYYSKTGIDESKGEKWFCSEADAQSAGWRKSKS